MNNHDLEPLTEAQMTRFAQFTRELQPYVERIESVEGSPVIHYEADEESGFHFACRPSHQDAAIPEVFTTAVYTISLLNDLAHEGWQVGIVLKKRGVIAEARLDPDGTALTVGPYTASHVSIAASQLWLAVHALTATPTTA